MTATKAKRFARVAETLFADWVKVNTYGSDDDGSYEVMADGHRTVRWTRIGQPTRTYRVKVTLGGTAVGCNCDAGRFGKPCKHTRITTGLIAQGKFVLPADVQEAAECMAGAEFPHNTECE